VSSSGNIFLQHNPKLESALVRLKELEGSRDDFALLVRQLEELQESAIAGAIAAKGETAQRALGALGAYRVALAIIRDADGAEYRPPEGQEDAGKAADGGDDGEDEE